MNKKIIFGLFIVSIMVLVGCEEIDLSKVSEEDIGKISEKLIVCNEPYMRYASGCCLDQNDNKICDKDEKGVVIEEAIPEEIVEEGVGPDKFLPSTCTMPSGIACLDHKADTNGIILVLQNAMGYDIKNINVWISGCGTAKGVIALTNGAKNTYKASCSLTAGSQSVSTIEVSYTIVDTGLSYTKTGSISTRVEGAELVAEEIPEGYLGTCTSPSSGLVCLGHKVTATGVTILLQNLIGYDINKVSVSFEDCGMATGSTSLEDGAKDTYTASCDLSRISKYLGDITVNYGVIDTGLTYTKIGRIVTKIE